MYYSSRFFSVLVSHLFAHLINLVTKSLLLTAEGLLDDPAEEKTEEDQVENHEEINDLQGTLVANTQVENVVEESHFYF